MLIAQIHVEMHDVHLPFFIDCGIVSITLEEESTFVIVKLASCQFLNTETSIIDKTLDNTDLSHTISNSGKRTMVNSAFL